MNRRRVRIKWENFILSIFVITAVIIFSTIISEESEKFIIRRNLLNQEIDEMFELRDENFYIKNPIYEIPNYEVGVEKNLESEENKEDIVKKLTQQYEEKQELQKKSDGSQTDADKKSKYYLQIGIFSNNDFAKATAELLKNYNVKISEDFINENKFYKVIIDGMDTRDVAEEFRREIVEITESEIKPLIRVRY